MRSAGVVVLLMITWVRCSLDFPPGFQFGAATAAYQVEGAWNVNGRTPSVWDVYVHTKPEAIIDHSTGDVACDSYHLWRRDVEMASELGLHYYRFSISWTRLFPNGFTNHVNEDGRRYYSDLIDALIDKGIEPVVTLYHWDLPHKFQELGGWTNPLVIEWFGSYARGVYSLYGDRVSTWLTINEPIVLCDLVYQTGLFAPGIISPGLGNFICMKNVLMAHAKAWRIYDEEFRNKYNGRVAIINNHFWFEPDNGTEPGAVELSRELYSGMYTHPIYSSAGGWPPLVEKVIFENSVKEGYTKSRLPAFTQEEKEFVRGTYDFYGLNYYTTKLVRNVREGEKIGAWPLEGSTELNLIVSRDPSWKQSAASWLSVFPKGIRRQLKWFRDHFGDVEIFIMENGYADYGAELEDYDRVEYYRDHLKQVLLAIHEDGVRVTRYTAWSLMDNFEWFGGYNTKFGLYAVDFSSPKRTRTPRSSARYYASVIEHHSLNFNFSVTSGGGRPSLSSYTNLVFILGITYLCKVFIF